MITAVVGLGHFLNGAALTWDRVPAEELAIASPLVESEGSPGVEVLFRETSVDESDNDGEDAIIRTHVRFKVFDERGVARLEKIDIPYDASGTNILAIGARVIKPDGTITSVERSAFYTRKIVRNRYLKLDVITFAPPALEPGVIVEYKYALQSPINYAGFFPMQDEFPTRVVRFRVKPPPEPHLNMRTLYFHCPQLEMNHDPEGYFGVALERVPGAIDEPFSPPDDQVRSWLIYYYTFVKETPGEYWSRKGRELYKDSEKDLKSNAAVQKASAAITAGAKTDFEKIEHIDKFCRTEIANLAGDASGYTPDQIKTLKTNKGPGDTLANKYGWPADIRNLYIALARAAGFDARVAYCSDRSGMAFDPNMPVSLMVPDRIVAINISGVWWFAQPNIPYVPFGSLHWTDEGETALISDPKNPPFARTLTTTAEATENKRTAQLTLDADGMLEGDVEIVLTGHLAVDRKQDYDDETPGRREELVRDDVRERLPAAEVTAITLDNITGPTGPVTIKYHLKVPGYAQVTGQRLFVQPSVFELGAPPIFTADARKNPVFFPFQEIEVDHVEIKIPDGFALENAHAPEALPLSATLNYEPKLSYRTSDRTLVYDRRYEQKLRTVAAAQYAIVRSIFDHIHKQDAHTVGLRREELAAPAAAN